MSKIISGKFISEGKELADGPVWCMTLLAAGSMRFRWNEENPIRGKFFSDLFMGRGKSLCAPELIHSKTVYDISDLSQIEGKTGDGVITRNSSLVPSVTVADCMPLFVYDRKEKVFGALHSGWKGTGIVGEAVSLMEKNYGSLPENISVVIGPHIGSCCYQVEADRAKWFSENFTPECVERRPDGKFDLSLTRANLSVLEKCGVPSGNILVRDECTCCHKELGQFKFGSFRRQAAFLPESVPFDERMRAFTVQAAFVFFE